MEKGIRFKNPPLVEALCEFRFQKTGVLPNIVLGKLYERIENDFPKVETYRGIGVQAGEGITYPAIIMEERTRFINQDSTQLIQVGPGVLVINQLKPYKDYSSFRAFVKSAVDTYYAVAKPEGLLSIGLRYINRIEMRIGQPLEEIFNIGFVIPSTFFSFPDPYLLRMEFTYREGQDRLIVTFASAPQTSDQAQSRGQGNSTRASILDFDYVLAKPAGINSRLLDWMDSAHERIEEAFHACLTESTLATFGVED